MNWILRLKNKTVLVALIAAVVAFVYQVCGLIGIVPTLDENTVIQTCGLIVNVLVALGIIVDPTTAGFSDSAQAMTYDKPRDYEILEMPSGETTDPDIPSQEQEVQE